MVVAILIVLGVVSLLPTAAHDDGVAETLPGDLPASAAVRTGIDGWITVLATGEVLTGVAEPRRLACLGSRPNVLDVSRAGVEKTLVDGV